MKELFCLDTHILIWGIKKEAQDDQRHMIVQTSRFFKEIQNKKIPIIIPSVVVGEFLYSVPHEKHPEIIKILSESFQIVPFDAIASSMFAKIWSENKTIDNLDNDLNRKEIKFDYQIIATAITRGATCIFSHDKPVKKLGEKYIKVLEIEDYLNQLELF